MTKSEIETKKVEIIAQIVNIYDDFLLEQIEKLLLSNKDLISVSDWERKELDKGLEDIKKGNLISHEDVQKEIEILLAS